MITIKSNRELDLMREAGRIVALCHKAIKEMIEPGVTTQQINDLVDKIIRENGATPSFLNYGGFPASVCASVNECVVHGFPNNKKLVEGDIVSIDIGANYKGYHGDSAWTYPVGKISNEDQILLKETEASLFVGLEQLKDGIHLSDVSHAIEEHAKKFNLGIVREFAGHGVGSELHEAPEILNYGKPKRGPILRAGMTLAIEPMLNAGKDNVRVHADGWTVTTVDKKNAAHFEHTIAVTKEGYEILTKI